MPSVARFLHKKIWVDGLGVQRTPLRPTRLSIEGAAQGIQLHVALTQCFGQQKLTFSVSEKGLLTIAPQEDPPERLRWTYAVGDVLDGIVADARE
jgi:hypothetical protein